MALNRRNLTAAAMVFFAVSVAALAQVGANVGGVVTDGSGASVPGATVTLTNTNNGDSQTVKASAEGSWRAVNLPPAAYQITAESAGFGTVKKNITLLVGSDVTVDFTLGVAGVTETVTVSGDAAALVETTKSAPKSVVNGGELADLPVLNRNFLVVAQNMPGAAATNNLATTNRFSATKFGGVADQSSGYTTLIDGAAIDDATWGAPVINMSQDAIQEFTVYRNQFDAQYGHALNAVVSVVTKSGGEDYHGTLYYFGRDVSLNARNAYAAVAPPYSLFRGGATFGGPLKKGSRTHFFASGEYLDIHTAGIVSLPATNPFAARENGNYPFTQTEKIGDVKMDHSFSDRNTFYARYAYDHFYIPNGQPSNSSAAITDDSRAHSLVLEDNWIVSPTTVNTLRYVFLHHNLATLPGNNDTTLQYLDFTFGQNTTSPQFFPRTNHMLADTVFISKSNHDIKIGVEANKQFTSYLSHYFEHGLFVFTTDLPFSLANPATWPTSFKQQTAGNYYHHSLALGPFIQDDWRVLPRLRLNLGFRYDYETNLRDNSFYSALLSNPAFTGVDHFVSNNRGTDASGWQPRLGLAWDVTGKGSMVIRAGFGKYMTREREYWNNAAETQTFGAAVVITDTTQLQRFPDITAVLNGKSLSSYVLTAARSAIMIPDNFRLPYSWNSTVGFGWRVNSRSSLNVDFVHTHDQKDLGETDVNLPATGKISTTNPRPVPQFGQVAMITNLGQAWYDAMEIQYRTSKVKGFQNVSASYTLSKSIINGVTWYSTFSGTDRFRDNYAYNPTHTPNNLSLTFTTAMLPGKIQLSGSFHAVSGPPQSVSAGFDLDGDSNTSNDRPRGLQQTVGYGNTDGQLALINAFRANPCSFVYSADVTCTAKALPAVSANLLSPHPSVSLDLRLMKALVFKERKRLELFFEGYNVANYVTRLAGTGTMTSTSFLIPASSLAARQLQWGVRFNF